MEQYLQTFPFWTQLTEGERETIRGCAYLRRFDAGGLIYAREQECLGLVYVISGTVRSFMLSEEGREILLYRVSAGDCDVLSASCVLKQIEFSAQMVAETDCELLILPAVCLSGIKAENVHLRCFLYAKLGERFSEVMLRMQQMMFHRVDERLGQVLLRKADETGCVRATHEALAAEISSSREVVSRMLKRMEAAGTVRLGRGSITLLRPEEFLSLSNSDG